MFKFSFPKSLKLLGFQFRQTGLCIVFFCTPPTLTLWNRWKHDLRKCAKSLSIGNFPASRPGGSAARHRRRYRQAGSGARWPGGIGGSNRTGSGRQAPWRMGRRAGWRRGWRIGWPTAAASRKAGRVPHGPPPGSSFASFREASAGRGGRTSGVDGADIGCGGSRVKEKYRKKGNNFERPLVRHPPPIATPAARSGGRVRLALLAARVRVHRHRFHRIMAVAAGEGRQGVEVGAHVLHHR